MEIRKIQMSGGSTYIVSLPKSWVKMCGLGKNDPVGVIVQQDRTLLVTPKITDKAVERTKRFDIRVIDGSVYLFRCLIGAYVSGFDYIEVRGKDELPLFAKDTVRKFTKATIGPEIVDEGKEFIVMKDILNPVEMPLGQTIRRMMTLVRSMHEEVIHALISRGANACEVIAEVIERDDDVDRLYWLTMRQTNMIAKNWKIAEKMGISPNDSVYYFRVSRIIERIGDHASKIASNALELLDKRVDKGLLEPIGSASGVSLGIFSGAMDAFFKKDLKMANDNIDRVERLEKMCNELNHAILKQKGAIALSLGRIVESIRRTGEYSGDISEQVMNYLIDSEHG